MIVERFFVTYSQVIVVNSLMKDDRSFSDMLLYYFGGRNESEAWKVQWHAYDFSVMNIVPVWPSRMVASSHLQPTLKR